MNKNILSTTIVASFVLCTSLSATASDGTVNFTGNIIDSACVVDLGSAGATSMDVIMGNVNKSVFTGVGSTGGSSATKFNLVLKDCPDTIKTATVKFDGISYKNDNTVLALTAEDGVAEGVAIQLSDKSGVLPLYTASATYDLESGKDKENTLDFYARYIQTEDKVTAGTANSIATFTVNY